LPRELALDEIEIVEDGGEAISCRVCLSQCKRESSAIRTS
jgi:hypothetical protein